MPDSAVKEQQPPEEQASGRDHSDEEEPTIRSSSIISPIFTDRNDEEMKVIAIIQEQAEIYRILRYLVKQGRSSLELVPASLK